MRYARQRQAIIDGISMNPDEFYSAVNVKKICSLGNLSLDVMYVIPEDTEKYGDNPIDIMSDDCPKIDGTDLPFNYDESTLLNNDEIRMVRNDIEDEFSKAKHRNNKSEYTYTQIKSSDDDVTDSNNDSDDDNE